ncbi:hypothetical protein PVAP13_3KG413581 [Panicum virgatum]|uniref:Uncharacterized protein n=1 Tax=Panicum virgatum TaxID=38727 RepID=A0A8T0V2Z5_PANVG|nr:hypothetical protein PVAP13_3KG413581 [Panicum virgatum]
MHMYFFCFSDNLTHLGSQVYLLIWKTGSSFFLENPSFHCPLRLNPVCSEAAAPGASARSPDGGGASEGARPSPRLFICMVCFQFDARRLLVDYYWQGRSYVVA